MGQFLDYLASVFSNKVEPQEMDSNRVTPKGNTKANINQDELDRISKITSLTQSNKRTIFLYETIGALAFLIHLSLVTVPKFQLESFDLLEPQGWQLVTLSLVPIVIYFASIGAMLEINKPISEDVELTSKNSGLDLNNNDFIHSLKVLILLMALCQLSSIFSDQILWSVVMIVPVWCYLLTSRVAQNEYKRYAPEPASKPSLSPKKRLFKINISRSPKNSTPSERIRSSTAIPEDDLPVRATPRTRTRRAVKNMINGVSDKYHAFEQNVAHQLSQKIFNPASPKLKTIEIDLKSDEKVPIISD